MSSHLDLLKIDWLNPEIIKVLLIKRSEILPPFACMQLSVKPKKYKYKLTN